MQLFNGHTSYQPLIDTLKNAQISLLSKIQALQALFSTGR